MEIEKARILNESQKLGGYRHWVDFKFEGFGRYLRLSQNIIVCLPPSGDAAIFCNGSLPQRVSHRQNRANRVKLRAFRLQFMLPDRSSPRQAHRAFTLVEMLVVIGIITILAGLVVVNVTPIFEAWEPNPRNAPFARPYAEARYQATMHKETTYLHFSAPRGGLLSSPTPPRDRTRPCGNRFWRGCARSEFSISPNPSGARPWRTNPPHRDRSQVPRVRFQPDRSSTPFEVEITWGAGPLPSPLRSLLRRRTHLAPPE